MPEPRERRVPKRRAVPQDATQTRRVPPYNVVLVHDEDHSFDFVVNVLPKVLGASLERARQLTLEAHTTGRAVIWTGPKEVAELKVEQVESLREVRAGVKLGPVMCTIEPAPGA